MSEKQGSDNPAPKSKHFKEQFDDEETMMVFRKHPIVMRKGLILASFGMLVGPVYTLILTYVHKNNPPSLTFFFASLLASFIIAWILIFPWWVKWYFSVYIMTNKRFIQQNRSLLQVDVVDIGLDQIQMINYQVAGLEETILHFGTIIVQTYVGDLVIRQVHHPEKVQSKMVHILRDLGIHHSARTPQHEETAAKHDGEET
ncbi:MAG TPA: PH domain-containing protein [Candidatus Saccharimonadales bacterium]|nr:PH domain-containing protein [Candidatus Saccharimonadales bacterium]